MRRKSEMQDLQDESTWQVRPFPFYVMIICGFLLILIGLYLFIANQVAHGFIGGRYSRGSNGASGFAVLNGITVIIFGIPFLATGAYVLVFKQKHVKRKKRIPG